ncbi:MAG: aspartyl-tRNA(Asn)/glutamyl-tRNA(Gln) amidotransferase subunit A [Gammaproteobacteria bacterium]|jgi:aspartyl-tRNA(Asn)/glutamyl-tRNA(Gln) amidotransferase subunit A
MKSKGLRSLANQLADQSMTSRELCEKALDRSRNTQSVFINLNEDILYLADLIDQKRKSTAQVPALAGIPIALKDLFDVRHQKTLAGSVVLKDQVNRAEQDAAVVAPLRNAGLLFLGRLNMSEFAFSGMGMNPHYGTPLSVWDRVTGHLPGGSSSGSGVVVGEGIVAAALGSDTAGSCRIPAAFNGIVGVKPSYGRLPLTGIFPLSHSSDAPGPLAVDVDSCHILDRFMMQDPQAARLPEIAIIDPAKLTLIVPDADVMRGLDDTVQNTFEAGVTKLKMAGFNFQTHKMPSLDGCIEFFKTNPVAVYEAYQLHRQNLENHFASFDPFVGQRILTGKDISPAEQQDRYEQKSWLIKQFNAEFSALGADAVLYPTVACIPPAISDCKDSEQARIINLNCLRNTATVNNFDGCSISLPCHKPGEAPVGLMVSARNGEDEKLYQVAAALESALRNET